MIRKLQPSRFNIAEYLPEMARKHPWRRAVVFPQGRDPAGRVAYTHLTYSQLNRLCDDYAHEFRSAGVERGMTILVMLRPSLEFIAAVFAVFKSGGVPVLIDPGMGRKNLLNCVKNTGPEAMIAESEVHWARRFFPGSFKTIKIAFSRGKRPPPRTRRLEELSVLYEEPFKLIKTKRDETAAILFTTGSTGPPKGVVYTHGIFIAQTEIIRKTYGLGPWDLDMPAFPLFALFSAALGMTCVIPDMDPSHPADVDPERIIEAVLNQGVTFSFGSPALWRKVADHCQRRDVQLLSLHKVLMAGAPVEEELHRSLKSIIDHGGETVVPYGATEALPIANFTGGEVIADTGAKTAKGAGYCVGHVLGDLDVRVIEAIDDPIERWEDVRELPTKEIGEIVVNGPVVTREYYNLPEQTKLAKIKDEDGSVWHRMGDMGYFDDDHLLWFCGRKSHRVITRDRIYYPVRCEAIFNAHPNVARAALVGVERGGETVPLIIAEPSPDAFPRNSREKKQFIEELRELGENNELTRSIQRFLFHRNFPVDIRHNAKIFREKLAAWATKKR